MTAISVKVTTNESARAEVRRAGLVGAWMSSMGAFVWPGLAGRVWPRVGLWKAIAVGVVNLLLTIPWMVLVVVTWGVWSDQRLFMGNFTKPFVADPAGVYWKALAAFPATVEKTWHNLQMPERVSAVIGPMWLAGLFMGLLFFMLVPFAARPGRNKACVVHVIRTVLLSTGFVHLWAPVLVVMNVCYAAYRYPPGLENVIEPLLIALMLLVVWGFGVMVHGAKSEYRKAEDYPQPRDPTCDVCGYNLLMAEMSGRCPECGKPVSESLGEHVRMPTEWEKRPSLLNAWAILRQAWLLVRSPQMLFASMPTMSGQSAAHRWLIATLVVIAAEAFWIMPAYVWTGVALEMEWKDRVLGGMAIGVVWAFLALMMVGIETVGIATFSRMKGNPVTLATAAKVTAYSAMLMLPWVVLGGAQLIAMSWAWDPHTQVKLHVTVRTLQIFTTGSMAIAHIGGLLWYEFTVYRGIKSVQWANK